MPNRWKTRADVDETPVMIMNVLDRNPDLPNRRTVTIISATADSDKRTVRYFFKEVKKHIFGARNYLGSNPWQDNDLLHFLCQPSVLTYG